MMKYDQLNFIVSVSAKSEEMTARMNEVFELKLTLAQHFINKKYKFAVVSEDVVSNELQIGVRYDFIVSVIPKSYSVLDQIDEEHVIKNDMAKVISNLGYKYIIADEDMMSEFAKQKIQYLPKEGEYNV